MKRAFLIYEYIASGARSLPLSKIYCRSVLLFTWISSIRYALLNVDSRKRRNSSAVGIYRVCQVESSKLFITTGCEPRWAFLLPCARKTFFNIIVQRTCILQQGQETVGLFIGHSWLGRGWPFSLPFQKRAQRPWADMNLHVKAAIVNVFFWKTQNPENLLILRYDVDRVESMSRSALHTKKKTPWKQSNTPHTQQDRIQPLSKWIYINTNKYLFENDNPFPVLPRTRLCLEKHSPFLTYRCLPFPLLPPQMIVIIDRGKSINIWEPPPHTTSEYWLGSAREARS